MVRFIPSDPFIVRLFNIRRSFMYPLIVI